MKNSTMLYSVSAVALAAAGATTATAQSMPEGYSLSVQGGIADSNDIFADKVGSGGPFSGASGYGYSNTATYGYMGAVSIERRVNATRDYTIGVTAFGNSSFTRSITSGYFYASGFSSGGSGGYSGYASGAQRTFSMTNSIGFQALDFELGHRTSSTSEMDVRMFAGLRAMQSVSDAGMSVDKVGAYSGGSGYYGYSIGMNVNSTFVGVGPRVGAGVSSRAAGSNFGFSGKVGAAALFGQRTDQITGSGTEFSMNSGGYSSGPFSGGPFSGGPFSGGDLTEVADKTVFSMDVDLGVDYYLNNNSKVTLGYKAQQMWNVDISSDTEQADDGPRLLQSVYLGWTTSF